MLGMLVGGILWGWGDKKGRITVLFGSILLYSAANIINAFTFDVVTYGIVRFIAGVGLAGELGAGITLITETMSREKRGYGTMVVVVFGALGAVFADEVYAQGQRIGGLLTSLTGHAFMNWQVAYIVGGAMGLLLLVLRVGAFESGLFARMKERTERRGDLMLLFGDRERFLKYLGCILIGVPVWYVIGVLVNLSQDVFVPELGIDISALTEAERLRINGKGHPLRVHRPQRGRPPERALEPGLPQPEEGDPATCWPMPPWPECSSSACRAPASTPTTGCACCWAPPPATGCCS